MGGEERDGRREMGGERERELERREESRDESGQRRGIITCMSRIRSKISRHALENCTWRVRRGENGDLGGLWLQSYGLSVRSEVMGRLYRVRRAAPSL